MEDAFWKRGLSFSCRRCSACCRGEPGYVFLGMDDLDRLRDGFSLSRKDFLRSWCRIVDFGQERLWSLREKPNNDCIFWDGGCSVYDRRPSQCKTYPFWQHILSDAESWNREASSCPGIGTGSFHGADEIAEALLQRRKDRPLGPDDVASLGAEGCSE